VSESGPPYAPADAARKRLGEARRQLRGQSTALREAENRLAALLRDERPDGAALAAARAAVERARGARRQASEGVKAASDRLASDLRTGVAPSPDGDVARLSAAWPIVLLPVRIETRFRGTELLLRVYPDEVFAETHEPELTDQEVGDGTRFWTAAWPGLDAERTAWKALVDALGAPRAAWVAQVMTPQNLAERPDGNPVLPDPARRTGAWTRAAEARLLPDHFVVALYAGAAPPRIVAGSAVVEPLVLTISPDPEEARSPLTDDGLEVDDAVRWTVDFDAAEKIGMALRIPLSAEEQAGGFDRVVVTGVKSTLTPEQSADELRGLLEGHRFGRGLALVPQGTPTNNTSAARAPFPPPDPDGRVSFGVERREIGPLEGRDGGALMQALGLPVEAAAHLAGADGREQERASAMARALWPVTIGYFLEQLMAPVFDRNAIRQVHGFFVNDVRGRGPLPAFRVGNTPYGVLPVSSLPLWQAEDRVLGIERELPAALLKLSEVWAARTAEVPHVGRSTDPDEDLLSILGVHASTREVRVRPVLGEDAQWNLFGLFGWSDAWGFWQDAGQQLTLRVLERVGHREWRPRIGRFNFGPTAWPFRYGLVTESLLSEAEPLVPNYIDWIRTADVPTLRAQSFPGGPPVSLLYRLLRHGALLEYHATAFELHLRYESVVLADGREPELVDRAAEPRAPGRMARLERPLAPVSGRAPLQQFLHDPANRALLESLVPDPPVTGFRDALAVLAPCSTAELERLFTETLDVVSHRLDAWITALATRRLRRLREARPMGCYLGAYGWVEDLRPKPRGASSPVRLPDGRMAERQADNGGYVHAPSMTHASTAAVLRNAYLSRTDETRARYAVDLCSSRVRLGRFILDAVRQGQPLGAVLGYRVERGLHDQRQDKWIALLRRLYPLVAKKSKDPLDMQEPTEQIAARNVVDGLALHTAFVENRVPWGESGLPAGGAERAAIEAELRALDEAVDAVSDLLLAESVYQVVKGSPTVAAATLDAMAQGALRPPDPEIATQPRRGTPLSHRIAIVLGDGAPPLPPGWPADPTPRAELEPGVDAWLGRLFGPAARVRCRVEIGPRDAPTGSTAVSLAELRLRPIDVLALSRALGQQDPAASRAAASELDRRIQDVAFAKLGVEDEVETRILYEAPAGFDPAVDRTFTDVLETARAVERVLGKARPLVPRDLAAEDREADVASADRMPAEAIARATAARDVLDQRRQVLASRVAAAAAADPDAAFDLAPLRSALAAIALVGVSAAYPRSSVGQGLPLRQELIAQGTSVVTEAERRLSRAEVLLAVAADPAKAADAAFQVSTAREVVGVVFGADARFLPRFRPAAAGELANAIEHGANVVFIDSDPRVREREIRRFEAVAARVRPALDALRRLDLLGRALGAEPTPRRVAQLPYDAAARWVALPFPDEAARPRPGRVSVLLRRVAAPAPADPWAGLLVDEWAELIPMPTEQTGIAFHYDDPGAEAPQTVLVAVPPAISGRRLWDLDSLLAILTETFDLARIRGVDGELLGELGQLLPAVYLADSTEDVTVRTDFSQAILAEAVITRLQET
jgi:hypothetical protein